MRSEWSDMRLREELGARLRRERLNQNLTQAVVADRAGVRRATISEVERGDDFTMGTLLAILRALGRIETLDSFLPAPEMSPLEILRQQGKRTDRQRASSRVPEGRVAASSPEPDSVAAPWRWADDADPGDD